MLRKQFHYEKKVRACIKPSRNVKSFNTSITSKW